MAISDFFSGGQTPDYLAGLLDDEQLRRLKANAQQNALMQFGLSALSQGGYSQTPVGAGEIFGKAGLAGMQGYQQGIQGGIEGIGLRQKLEEAKLKKEQEAKRKAYMEQFVGTLPANQQAAALAMPELGQKLAENQFIPTLGRPLSKTDIEALRAKGINLPTDGGQQYQLKADGTLDLIEGTAPEKEQKFKVGDTRSVPKGNQTVTEEYGADGKWRPYATSPKWEPPKPEKPSPWEPRIPPKLTPLQAYDKNGRLWNFKSVTAANAFKKEMGE